MNRFALSWVDTAIAAEEERDEFRRAYDALLADYLTLARAYHELRGWRAYEAALGVAARTEIERRWPEERAA